MNLVDVVRKLWNNNGLGRPFSYVMPVTIVTAGNLDEEDGDALAPLSVVASNFPTQTQEILLLPSATRTATTVSDNIVNTQYRGILVFLRVTVASGTGGLTLRFSYRDPATGTLFNMNNAPTAVVAVGLTMLAVYPAISGTATTQANNMILPRNFSITVTHGDASSYTYSVWGCWLP